MPLFHIFLLAIVQGITEFFPISSSGHLILTHAWLEGGESGAWKEDLIMDLAVHVGTLAAVLIYFRRDVAAMLAGLFHLARGRRGKDSSRLFLFVLVASLPVLAVGYLLHLWQPPWLRTVEVTAWCTLVYGVLLWWADRKFPATRTVEAMTWRDAALIGLAQTLSLIPGTSRSGITMTCARMLGFARPEAARYSLLLAIVATSAAGMLGAMDLAKADSAALTEQAAIAAVISCFAGFGAIAFMMRWLQKYSFAPFAIYRVILGLALLALIYGKVLV